MRSYDIAILGGGPGGYTAALRGAQRGATVCLIERGALGGTCLNVGCIPTKAMLHVSELAYRAGNASAMGLRAGQIAFDAETFAIRTARTVTALRKGVASLLKARKVDVIKGSGRLTAPTAIEVALDEGPQTVTAKSVIIATGSRPARPSFGPWDSDRVMTTDEATTTDELPASILIVGGGVIGCEFATFYAELGVKTVLVEMLDGLLGGLDADAVKVVTASLTARGVHIRTGATVQTMSADTTAVTTELSIDQTVITHAALIAVGRQPNTEDLGLDELGITLTDSLISVDDRCRTSVDHLYAIGDVACAKQYAHVATRMGIVAADAATGHDTTDDLSVVPECVYTHPEVASVGMSELEANDEFADVKVVRFPLRASGMAQAYGETDGLVKLIARQSNGRVLGALVIGPHATDTIHEVAVAIRHALTVGQLAETIHAHPTFAETIHEAAEAWTGLPTHMLR